MRLVTRGGRKVNKMSEPRSKFMDVFLVNGERMILTETQAERFDHEGKDVEWIESVEVIEDPLPPALDDEISCDCGECPECIAYFESLLED